MALMLGNLHDALTAAGASPELALKTAEEVAVYENRLAQVESKGDVVQWMVGANIALSLIIPGKTFFF